MGSVFRNLFLLKAPVGCSQSNSSPQWQIHHILNQIYLLSIKSEHSD